MMPQILLNRVILHTTTVGYYYHLVNVISLSLAQSDHIKRLTLYLRKLLPATKAQLNQAEEKSSIRCGILKKPQSGM